MAGNLTLLKRALFLATMALLPAWFTVSDVRAQTVYPPTVFVAFDASGMEQAALGGICAEFASIDPTIATCTQSTTPSLQNISGDASACLKPSPGQLQDFRISNAAIAQALAAIAAFYGISDITIVTHFALAYFPLANSCTNPFYLSVHENGQWYSLAFFGPVAPGASGDVLVGLFSIATPSATLPDGVLACSSPSAQGASNCPTGAPVPPTGCTLTASPAQLPVGGGSATLTAACSGGNPPTSFSWTGPGVNPSTTTPTQQVNVTATSTFSVVASNAAGAAPAASATVTVATSSGGGGGPPVCALTASPQQLPGSGGSVALAASCTPAATSYRWSGIGANPGSDASQQVNVNTSSTFSVIGTNSAGSSAPATVTVNVGSQKPYVFTTVDYPGGSSTQLLAINNVGQILGLAVDGSGQSINFTYQSGAFVPVPQPPSGAHGTAALLAISDSGTMAGELVDSTSGCSKGVIAVQDEAFATQDGFALGGAAYTFFTHPGYTNTRARGVSSSGMVTGVADSDCMNPFAGIAFLYDPGSGQFTDITFPQSTNTVAQGINANGQVVGSYRVPPQARTSYVRDAGGNVSSFSLNGGADTAARGINDLGTVTGFSVQGSAVQTFVGDAGNGFQLLNVPGAATTTGASINNAGQVVGLWGDASGGQHGFVGTPLTPSAGTTSGGAYTYSAAVTASTPIFVAPAVGSGFAFAVGASDPLFAAVQLPAGSGQALYNLTVAGQTFGASGGDVFDFRAHGFVNGVSAFSLTGIDTSVFSGAASARAFPIGLWFVGSGTFTGTQTPVGP